MLATSQREVQKEKADILAWSHATFSRGGIETVASSYNTFL